MPLKKQVLAIDDSKAIRFLLQTVLGKEFQVITVADGCSAMYWLSKSNFPQLIIADPQLPDMENWELIEHLSSSGLYKSIPIMVLSGLDKTETEAKCIEYEESKYFLKPFNPIDLVSAVHEVVQGNIVEAFQPM